MTEALFTELGDMTSGRHESSAGGYETWLTPPYILQSLGDFDLDPCAAPSPRPWSTAKTHWAREDNPLLRQWSGRVWLNPPYGPKSKIGPWMARMSEHNHGTALIFARTETKIFFDYVWSLASAVLFLRGRINFYRPNGTLSDKSGGGYATAPSVLVAYGDHDAEQLRISGLNGRFLMLPAIPSARQNPIQNIEAGA